MHFCASGETWDGMKGHWIPTSAGMTPTTQWVATLSEVEAARLGRAGEFAVNFLDRVGKERDGLVDLLVGDH